jgi:transcriptional regulator with XRE-family HTH domain
VPSAKNTTPQRQAFADAIAMHLGGMSRAELARRIGISPQALQQWFDGSTDPAPVNVFATERALGLPGGALSHVFGYVPVGATSVESAVAADRRLSREGRETVLRVYRSQVEAAVPARRRRR